MSKFNNQFYFSTYNGIKSKSYDSLDELYLGVYNKYLECDTIDARSKTIIIYKKKRSLSVKERVERFNTEVDEAVKMFEDYLDSCDFVVKENSVKEFETFIKKFFEENVEFVGDDDFVEITHLSLFDIFNMFN